MGTRLVPLCTLTQLIKSQFQWNPNISNVHSKYSSSIWPNVSQHLRCVPLRLYSGAVECYLNPVYQVWNPSFSHCCTRYLYITDRPVWRDQCFWPCFKWVFAICHYFFFHTMKTNCIWQMGHKEKILTQQHICHFIRKVSTQEKQVEDFLQLSSSKLTRLHREKPYRGLSCFPLSINKVSLIYCEISDNEMQIQDA